MRKVKDIYIFDNAVIVGDVEIGANTNIWPFVCIRGDVAPIRIGPGCSIQDHSMLHCKRDVALEIGANVIIGHHACVHCKSVGDRALIGIGARVLDNSEIGQDCLVAAGAVVRPGTIVPDGQMIAGVPARAIRDVTEDDIAYQKEVCERYVHLAQQHCDGRFPAFSGRH